MTMDRETIVFAVLAALLSVGVLAAVLQPLWRPRATRGRAMAMIAALLVAMFALYRLVGTPAALAPSAREPVQTLPDAIAQLQAQLRADPRQVEGWQLLGRALAAQGKASEARDALARAAILAADDPDVLVEAAEARALAHPQRRFDAPAVALLQHALQVQPRHQRALWFLGIAQRQSGNAAGAASTWESLLPLVARRTAVALREQIDLARREAGLPALAPLATAPALLHVQVELAPELVAGLHLDDRARVFVIARAVDGPPMPVAVEKHRVDELPLTVDLDDSDGPMPTQRLSQQPEVEVLARLSRSGTAIAQPGDMQSRIIRVHMPAKTPVHLVIDPAHSTP